MMATQGSAERRNDRSARIAVIICSVGRPEIVAELLPHLAGQSRPADRVLFVVTKPEDLAGDPNDSFDSTTTAAEVIMSEKGLTRQRNAGLDRVQDCDIVVFFDDDFVPSKFALEGIEAAFQRWPEVNGMTGRVIADGINGVGFSDEEASELVRSYDSRPHVAPEVLRAGLEGLYGCNMAYRNSAIGATRFDPALPLYGWQEDNDFAARLPGDRIKTSAFAGVHRGTKSGRETSGRRLGYSQVVNPYYLWRKGSMTPRFALHLATRNFVANHVKLVRPEPWTDRKGRAAGNWQALTDLVRGRAHPLRILDMKK